MSLGRNNKWQDDRTSVQDALSYMYKRSIFHDVTLQTTNDNGSSMCFSAHKLVLATRSPLFADMFYSKIQNSNIIPLNISTRPLDILLWYIYSDCIDIDDIEELLESYDAAVQYKISGFSESCVEKLLHLSPSFSASNLCSVINIAIHSESNELLNKCIQFIQKEPENYLLLEGLSSISEETLWKILQGLNTNECPKTLLKAVIKCMIRNNLSDKKFLSVIDFALFDSDDFLDVVVEFPRFFSKEEIQCITANLLLPRSSELPPWCTFSKIKERCLKIYLPSPYEGMEIIKENAVKIQTECSPNFNKVFFFGLHGFQQDLLLKIIVQCGALRLVMVELSFGSDYVPVDNLKVELRSNIGSGGKMQAINHYLLSSLAHYYLLLCDETLPETGSTFNLVLSVEATGLLEYGLHAPVSNQRYRTASVSSCDAVNLGTHCSTDLDPTVCLKPFDEWLLLVDPECGEKKFVISALYFDTLKNIRKYKAYLKN